MSKHTKIHKGKIPLEFHEVTFAKLRVEGWSYLKVSEWLLSEHGVEAAPSSVARLYTRIKEARGEMTKEAYSKAVAEAVPEDMKILAENVRMLRALQSDAFEKKDVNAVVKLSASLKEHVSLRANLAEYADKKEDGSISNEKIEDLEDSLWDLFDQIDGTKRQSEAITTSEVVLIKEELSSGKGSE